MLQFGMSLYVLLLNSLSKILVCGADEIVFILYLCLCLFGLLDFFYFRGADFFLFLWCIFYYE